MQIVYQKKKKINYKFLLIKKESFFTIVWYLKKQLFFLSKILTLPTTLVLYSMNNLLIIIATLNTTK